MKRNDRKVGWKIEEEWQMERMKGGEMEGRRVGKKTRERDRCGRGEGVGRGKLRKSGWERNLLSVFYIKGPQTWIFCELFLLLISKENAKYS